MKPRFSVLVLLGATAYIALYVAVAMQPRSIWPFVAFGVNTLILASTVAKSDHSQPARGPWILIVAGVVAIVGGWHDPVHPPGPPAQISDILFLIQVLGLVWLAAGGTWLLIRRTLRK